MNGCMRCLVAQNFIEQLPGPFEQPMRKGDLRIARGVSPE
jgi:hypothetical protein